MVFQSYAKYYDIIYSDKDYEEECDFLEEIFKEYSTFKPQTILDLGCGTGGHAIPLARRGYEVTGVDASEVMLCLAREKAAKLEVQANFYNMDIRDLKLDEKFDACICMFAVMNYLTSNEDIVRTLRRIREHLKDGSLFVFDFWYGPAVLHVLPEVRVSEIEWEEKRIIRIAEPKLDILSNLCNIDYRLIVVEHGKIVDDVKETHTVRYLFLPELKYFLEESGFELLKVSSFLDLNVEPSLETWNACAISRAKHEKNI